MATHSSYYNNFIQKKALKVLRIINNINSLLMHLKFYSEFKLINKWWIFILLSRYVICFDYNCLRSLHLHVMVISVVLGHYFSKVTCAFVNLITYNAVNIFIFRKSVFFIFLLYFLILLLWYIKNRIFYLTFKRINIF